MSMIPFWNMFPRSVLSPAFGGRLLRDDFFEQSWKAMERAMRQVEQQTGSQQHIVMDKNKFQVALDVQQFAPSELSVVVKGRDVVVEGKHKEKEDEHGFVSRHFVRRYTIPEGHEPEDVISNLTSDGVLTVTALRRKALGQDERAVPIQPTGSAYEAIKNTSTKAAEKPAEDGKMQE